MSNTEKQIPFKVGDIIYKEEYGRMNSFEVLKVDIKQMKIKHLDKHFNYTNTIRGADIFSFSPSVKDAYQRFKTRLNVRAENLTHQIKEIEDKIKSIDKIIEKES